LATKRKAWRNSGTIRSATVRNLSDPEIPR
jgi:hypothetical protein